MEPQDNKQPRERHSAPHPTMTIVMGLLFIAVVFVVFRVIPLHNGNEMTRRHARSLLRTAKSLEKRAEAWADPTLEVAAGSIYGDILGNPQLSDKYHQEALKHLNALLGRSKQAGAIVALLPKTLNDTQLKNYGLRAVVENALVDDTFLVQEALDVGTVDDAVWTTPSMLIDVSGEPVAQIGPVTVTLDELLFGWQTLYGDEPARGEAFGRYVHQYLDTVLMAVAAEYEALSERPAVALDVRMRQVLALSEAWRKELETQTPHATEEELAALWAQRTAEVPGAPEFDQIREALGSEWRGRQLRRRAAERLQALRNEIPVTIIAPSLLPTENTPTTTSLEQEATAQ